MDTYTCKLYSNLEYYEKICTFPIVTHFVKIKHHRRYLKKKYYSKFNEFLKGVKSLCRAFLVNIFCLQDEKINWGFDSLICIWPLLLSLTLYESIFFQHIAATNAAVIIAKGPAPGKSIIFDPSVSKIPPAVITYARFTDRFSCKWNL